MMEFDSNIFLEQIKTIRNLCDIVFVLLNTGQTGLLPTAVELMFVEIQQVNDDYCKKEQEDAR